MEDIGHTFRTLRKERGFTLKTMSDGIISFSYLSKFEKGESQISLTNFTQLLERLNMTIDEFLFSNGFPVNNYMVFFQKVAVAYNDKNLTNLKVLLRTEQKLYKEKNIIYHKFNAIMVTVVMNELDADFCILDSDINLFVDYFLKCSYWTTYEVSLFGNILSVFSDDLLIILIEEIKKRIQEYEMFYRNQRDLIGIIQNACIIFLRNEKIKEAKDLSEFLDTAIQKNHFFAKARQLYIDGIIAMALGARKNGADEVLKAIEIIEVLDPQYAGNHRIEFEQFQILYG